MTRVRLCGLALLVLLSTGKAKTQSGGSIGGPLSCGSDFKLMAAEGVPAGDLHGYVFQGICHVSQTVKSPSGMPTPQMGQVWTVAKISWRRSTGDFKEALSVKGTVGNKSITGTVTFTMKCAEDPVVTKASCMAGQLDNDTNWSGFDQLLQSPTPIVGKTTIAEATVMTKKAEDAAADNKPFKPATIPEPKKKPTEPKPVSDPVSQPLAAKDSVVFATHEIAPRGGLRIVLDGGRVLATRNEQGGLRWVLLNMRDDVLRLYPAGTKALGAGKDQIYIDTGSGPVPLGHEVKR